MCRWRSGREGASWDKILRVASEEPGRRLWVLEPAQADEESIMQPKTLILLFVALGCGLVAARFTAQLVKDNPPRTHISGEVVSVVVARKAIAAGTEITEPTEWFKLVQYGKGTEPSGAIQSFDLLKGRVMPRPVAENEPITERWWKEDQAPSLPAGMVGLSVLCRWDDMGLGYIFPGCRADVWAIKNVGDKPSSECIAENLLILAVNLRPRVENRPDGRGGPALVTFAVTPEQTQQLVGRVHDSNLKLILSKPEAK
jgi:Flp pilus assembly protein CpaB